MDATVEPLSFSEVFRRELEEIRRGRELRNSDKREFAVDEPIAAAHRAQLFGLAFSGGGIRSATFNLGILQALAELGILRFVDYLSTVSGGGYIGSWLAAWIGRNGFDQVEQKLKETQPSDAPATGPQPLNFLRQFSNYLTPRMGVLSADTWTVIAIWMRNTLMNCVILGLALSSVLIMPRLLVHLGGVPLWIEAEPYLASVTLLIPVLFVVVNQRGFGSEDDNRPLKAPAPAPNGSMPAKRPFWARQSGIQWLIVFPICISAWLTADRLWIAAQNFNVPYDDPPWIWTPCLVTGAVFFVLLFLLGATGGFLKCYLNEVRAHPGARWPRTRGWLQVALFAGVAAAAGCFLIRAVLEVFRGWSAESAIWHVPAAGTPLILLVYSAMVVLHLGLLGRTFPDERREWFSRVGAWISIYTFAWVGLFSIAVYGPLLIAMGIQATNGWVASGVSAGWLATTVAGLLAGHNARSVDATAEGHAPGSRWMNLVAKAAPVVFVCGLMLLLSEVVHLLLSWFVGGAPALFPGARYLIDKHWELMNAPHAVAVVSGFAGTLVAALLLSLRVDINEFSMHHLYKNRLVRCYLGASNTRRPNPFTGFDASDDVRLAELAPRRAGFEGPYPIVNAALNLVHGEEMAWQERKAASFVFTPLACGFDVEVEKEEGSMRNRYRLASQGYRPTIDFAYRGGMRIGTAMAISGAAASPNMGYHSSVPVAFLLTVFNVRLGWWLGNPRHSNAWQKPGPRLGLASLAYELFGFTDDNSKYVYLSDGGHFENLGIYELVRRRCRFIIACDSGEDRGLKFEDLGNAIRKCRADFGIDIEIDVDQIRRQAESKYSPWHCVVGAIHYERRDADAMPGFLVYIKSSLTGDEPADVLEYAARSPEFPHQSTGDQWFDESQFESYRRLGKHIGTSIFEATAEAADLVEQRDKESFFLALRQQWFPPSAAVAASFTKHAQALDNIFQRLRTDRRLRFLDAQIYPEWRQLMDRAASPPPLDYWLPHNADELRAGFYFCNSLIQLMESVYLDLNLEREHGHPDDRGWINLFRHWAWSGMFRVTWAISASSYGARFQSFCEHHLGLNILKAVKVDELKPTDDLAAAGLNFVEADLLGRFRAQKIFEDCPVYAFRIEVENPVISSPDPYVFRFTYGFAMAHNHQVVCFRVQDHLRKMGLARLALAELVNKLGITGVIPENELPEAVRNLWSPSDRKGFQRLFDSVMGTLPAKLHKASV